MNLHINNYAFLAITIVHQNIVQILNFTMVQKRVVKRVVENFNRPLKFRGWFKNRKKSINSMLEVYQSYFTTPNVPGKG